MFTPKIVPEDAPDPIDPQTLIEEFADEGELDLPGELTLLADRLSREAVLLAERFPADQPPALSQTEVRLAESETAHRPSSPAEPSRARRYFGPALVLLLVISVSVAIAWRQSAPDVTASGGSERSAWNALYRPDETARNSESVSATSLDNRSPPASLSPASFVHELTGPEMEGLLDLLEREEAGDSRLSI
jgi:hypothetical protein